MDVSKIIFKKCLALLFICVFYFFPSIRAIDRKDHHDGSVYKVSMTVSTMGGHGKYLLPADSVPGNGIPEKLQEWEILFDGKNTDKWNGLHGDSFPSHVWAVENGNLFVRNHGAGEDIITRSEYSNFELAFDFKLTDTANSGIKYLVGKIKNNTSGNTEWNGPEYQIIDDYKHPAVKNHIDDKASTASLYLIYAPKNKKLFPSGQWNNGKIIVNGRHIEHWLNGVKVMSCERGTEDFRRLMMGTKFKVYDNYGEAPGGHIMLTDHEGDKVYFRDIKIRRLKN